MAAAAVASSVSSLPPIPAPSAVPLTGPGSILTGCTAPLSKGTSGARALSSGVGNAAQRVAGIVSVICREAVATCVECFSDQVTVIVILIVPAGSALDEKLQRPGGLHGQLRGPKRPRLIARFQERRTATVDDEDRALMCGFQTGCRDQGY